MTNEKKMIPDEQLDQVSGGTTLPHRVQPGETLEKIAEKYNVTVEDLIRWNKIQNPNRIAVDQLLKIKF